ncbi:hypothetical protein LPTSP4_17120 [Leptospira ryugenii]|uniref:Uncharacterized protein n=2 Tax=Leptospira ryugenii TaxID=1917863 RepID=A0A2P2DZX3_9LEPT|nr:hypothetical protein LPTSP4_17120 [Leptospira ryugenii]
MSWEKVEDLNAGIKKGGNVNQIDPDYEISILMKAIETTKPELVKALLDAKANVNLKIPKTQKTALMHFMEKYTMVLENGTGENSEYVDDENMLSIFKMLIKAGARATDKDADGKSVLSYAIDSTYVPQSTYIMKQIIALKADPNEMFSNDIKKSICYYVAEDSTGYKSNAFRIFLEQKLCDPNKVYKEKNQRTNTLLYIAVSKNDVELVKLLLDAGANPNIGASDTMMDYLPLFSAISNREIFTTLLKKKANPNSVENDIHIMEHAARNLPDDEEGEALIDLLLQMGSDINHPKLFDAYTNDNKAVYASQVVGKERLETYLVRKGALDKERLKLKKGKK